MKVGDKVVLAQVGANLPNGVKISQSKIRGVQSNGMLCSEEELRLAEESEGIIILPPATPLGCPLAKILGRDDTILAFKLTANRGDCLSHLGMAREVAAALGQKVKKPPITEIEFKNSPISIHLEAGDAAPQFYGVYVEGVKIGPSPDWLVQRLEKLGSRSINNVVDATNLVLMELGHPMHAYDATFIQGGKIGVRLGNKGESLPLLDGQTVILAGDELVIEDAKRAIGLAGVMGGGNSEVKSDSTTLFLECAEFSPTLVRRAATKHQRRTEAAQRFERGIDPMGLKFAVSRLAHVIIELAGGRVKGATCTVLPSRDFSREEVKRTVCKQIRTPKDYFRNFLGMPLTQPEVERSLMALDCVVNKNEQEWIITVPSYRTDLSIKEDLAEEVARSIGYDQIPATVPVLTSAPSKFDKIEKVRVFVESAKDALVKAGLMESVNFAFTSAAWLKELGFEAEAKLINPLSEEYEVLVPSLLPGLIKNTLDNWRHHFGSEPLAVRLFEIRPTFKIEDKSAGIQAKSEMKTGVEEQWKISIALSGPRYAGGLRKDLGEVDFYDLKGVVEILFDALSTKGVRFQPLSSNAFSLLHPGQSAEILVGNKVAGHLGLLHPAKARQFKTRAPLWLAEIDCNTVFRLSKGVFEPRTFKPWPSFPPMERDFALVVRSGVSADSFTQVALKAGKPLAKVAKVFDIYKGATMGEGMTSVAVRVIFYDEARSIQESETEEASSRILEAWRKELGAELRS
ncbi:MAG: phenylalanine--tRNA ligase subunit beta, partial [Bdellovibrionales bacterium RIFOXYD1_FULL_44_7]